MSKISKLSKSRNQWKQKAISRGEENRSWRKKYKKIQQERERYKQEAKENKAKVKEYEERENLPTVTNKQDQIFLALQLFLVVSIGFRAVSRVLKVVAPYLGIKKAPCPQTVINWVNRYACAKIEEGKLIGGGPFLLIIDMSIGIGQSKILTVLALPADHHASHKAPTLQDVDCVGVKVSVSFTGQYIADFLKKIIDRSKNIQGCINIKGCIIDGGRDLAKGITLLEEEGYSLPVIGDLSHVIANSLKNAYANHPKFDLFNSACSQFAGKVKQTVLACLAPPKVQPKARFMNIHRLVRWADVLLMHSPKGRASKGSKLAQLREVLGALPQCKSFILKFKQDAEILLEFQKMYKENGVNFQTARQGQAQIQQLASAAVRVDMQEWLDSHIQRAKELDLAHTGLPISSDPIESLFGRAKQHGTGQIKDANRIAMRIPALCGTLTPEDAQRVAEYSCAQEHEVMGEIDSLTKQRRKILPHPGSLEELSKDHSSMELIAGSKSQSKKEVTHCNLKDYESRDGPP